MSDIKLTRKILDISDKIVDDIVEDLADRGGLDSAWTAIAEDVRAEILRKWRRIITLRIAGDIHNLAEIIVEPTRGLQENAVQQLSRVREEEDK